MTTFETAFERAVLLDRYTGSPEAGDQQIIAQPGMPEKDAADLHYAAAMALETARRAGQFKPSMQWMHEAVAHPQAGRTQESQNQLIDIIGMLHSIANQEGWGKGMEWMKQAADSAKGTVGTQRDSSGKLREQNIEPTFAKPSTKPKLAPFMVKRDDKPSGVSVRARDEQDAVQRATKWLGTGPATARPLAGDDT